MARKPESRSRRSITDISAMRASSANSEFWSFSPGVALRFALLFDACGFTAEIPEVVELCAADPAMAFNLDAIDAGGVEREHALHADPARNLANGEHLARSTAFTGDHHALEDLNALFVAFFDLDVDLDGVAGGEVRNVGTRFARLDDFHDFWHGFT